MFERILVPLDGSTLAETAIKTALRVAELDSDIMLLRAIELDPWVMANINQYPINIQNYTDNIMKESRAYLKRLGFSSQFEDVKVEMVSEVSEPAALILDKAEHENIDLIVMTTHGHRGIKRLALGSVTERVLRYAPCPVLVIREDEPINSILLTLDGSSLAETAVAPTLELAKRLGATVTLYAVDHEHLAIEDNELYAINAIEPGIVDAVRLGYASQNELYLKELKTRLIDAPVPITVLMSQGKAADNIINASESYDLVAMSTHGRTGIGRWMYGSVTENVLRSVETAMLIVRPDDDENNENS